MNSMVCLLLYTAFAAGGAPPTNRHLPEPARPAWYTTDRELQTPVSLNVHGRPLRVVLAELSKKGQVVLSATREVAEFRVSIRAENQPVARVMFRILDTFGHGKLPTTSHYWARVENRDKSLQYVFGRTRRGAEEEQELLDTPKNRVRQWLCDMRDYAHTPAEARKRFRSDNRQVQQLAREGASITAGENGPIGEVLAGLTDAQIDTLGQNGRVTLSQFSFSPEAVRYLMKDPQRPQDAEQRGAEAFSSPTLVLTREGREGQFDLTLLFADGKAGGYSLGYWLDTLNVYAAPEEFTIPEEKGDPIDLFATEKGRPSQFNKAELTSYLRLLAREAKMSLHAEIFLKEPGYVATTRGKPEFLLSEICRQFGCDWRKVGEDYIVWSKSWAQDRAADIAEPLLDRWRAAREKQGRFMLEDFVEMVRLSEPQYATLVRVLDVPGAFNHSSNRAALSLLTNLSAAERRAAFGAEGVEMRLPDPRQLALMQKLFDRPQIEFPLRVKLEQMPKGISIQFSDRRGAAYPRWLFQGETSDAIRPLP